VRPRARWRRRGRSWPPRLARCGAGGGPSRSPDSSPAGRCRPPRPGAHPGTCGRGRGRPRGRPAPCPPRQSPGGRWRGPLLRRRGSCGCGRARPCDACGAARRGFPAPETEARRRSAPGSRRGRAWGAAHADRWTPGDAFVTRSLAVREPGLLVASATTFPEVSRPSRLPILHVEPRSMCRTGCPAAARRTAPGSVAPGSSRPRGRGQFAFASRSRLPRKPWMPEAMARATSSW